MIAAFPLPALVRRTLFAAGLSLILLLLSGCDNANIVDFLLDPEPVQGTYQVTVSPGEVEMTVLNPTIDVIVSAVGVGDHLPPNLNQHSPGWRIIPSGPFQAVAASATSPSTTVTVTYTGAPNPSTDVFDPQREWSRYFVSGGFSAEASNAPDGLKATNGSFYDRYYYGPDVEDEIAETPRLTILPAKLPFLPGATRVLTVAYKGPNATFTSGGISQSVPNAFSWSMSPPPLKDGVSFPIAITYSSTAPAATGNFHLTTSNGVTVSVPLTGLGP